MSKELEAFNKLVHKEELNGFCIYTPINFTQKPKGTRDEYYKIVEQSLTPPTQEEVCEAYFKATNWHIHYYEETKCFMTGGIMIAINQDDGVTLFGKIPLHIAKMFVDFYEGVEKEMTSKEIIEACLTLLENRMNYHFRKGE